MEQENTKNEFPKELKAIPPVKDKAKCLEIATSIWKVENQVEKYTVFLAQEFFKNNIPSFSKKEFSTILKNRLFARKYSGQAAYDILKKCVEDEIVYPIILNNWFDKIVSPPLQLKYIDLLNNENNEEQLTQFNKRLEHLVKMCFEKTSNPSPNLIKLILAKDPQKVFNVKSWSDDIVAAWIKEHPENSQAIIRQNLSDFLNGKIYFPKSRKQLYSNVVNSYLSNSEPSQKENENFSFTFTSYPLDYIEYLEENHPKLFQNFIRKNFSYSSSDYNSPDNSLINGIQSIIFERNDPYYQTVAVFEKYKDLIKEDIKEEVGFYTKKTPLFEFCLRRKNFRPLALFGFEDNLSNEEQKIMVSSACMHLVDRYKDTSYYRETKNDLLNDWYPKIFVACPDDYYQKYIKKLKAVNIGNPEFNIELDAIELYRSLERKPSSNNGKKLKV